MDEESAKKVGVETKEYIYISKNVFEYQTATAAVNDDVEQPPSGDCVFWAGKLYIRPVDIRGSHPVFCQ